MKLLIVLFAVCLVSIYATPYVKRDAPATTNNFDELTRTFNVTTYMEKLGEQIGQTFNPEQIKKSFNEGLENFKKIVADVQTNLQSTPTQ